MTIRCWKLGEEVPQEERDNRLRALAGAETTGYEPFVKSERF